MNTTRLLAVIDLHLVMLHRLIYRLVFLLFWFPCVWEVSWREAACYYRPPMKLREGNVLSRVSLSVHGGPHVTLTHDALNLTIQGPSWHCPPPPGHDQTCSTWNHCAGTLQYWYLKVETLHLFKLVHLMPVTLVLPSCDYWSTCIRSASARYISYWNVFLSTICRWRCQGVRWKKADAGIGFRTVYMWLSHTEISKRPLETQTLFQTNQLHA